MAAVGKVIPILAAVFGRDGSRAALSTSRRTLWVFIVVKKQHDILWD
jgi:hypothetical protein